MFFSFFWLLHVWHMIAQKTNKFPTKMKSLYYFQIAIQTTEECSKMILTDGLSKYVMMWWTDGSHTKFDKLTMHLWLKIQQYHGCSPVLQWVLRNKYQLLWFIVAGRLFRRGCCKLVKQGSNHDIAKNTIKNSHQNMTFWYLFGLHSGQLLIFCRNLCWLVKLNLCEYGEHLAP